MSHGLCWDLAARSAQQRAIFRRGGPNDPQRPYRAYLAQYEAAWPLGPMRTYQRASDSTCEAPISVDSSHAEANRTSCPTFCRVNSSTPQQSPHTPAALARWSAGYMRGKTQCDGRRSRTLWGHQQRTSPRGAWWSHSCTTDNSAHFSCVVPRIKLRQK